jgi:hypothetical protein
MFATFARAVVMRWISLCLFGLVALFLIAFGVLYASVTNMLWFHAAAVPESVRDEVAPLYFALMKLIGGASSALGLLGFWMVMGPMRRDLPGIGVALTIAFAIPILMAAYVAEVLAARTGAPTSWHIMGVLIAILVLALLARRFGGAARSRGSATLTLSNPRLSETA